MKKKRIILIGMAALTGLLFPGCQKQPTACFSVSPTVLTPNHEVDFANCSTEAHSYEWDFGDGTTSTLAAPFHNYDHAGTYTVSLKAISENGRKTDVATESVVICNVATFQYSSPNQVAITVGNDTRYGYISNIYSDCTNQASFFLPVGTYTYSAVEQSPGTHTWNGSFTVTAQSCTITYLP